MLRPINGTKQHWLNVVYSSVCREDVHWNFVLRGVITFTNLWHNGIQKLQWSQYIRTYRFEKSGKRTWQNFREKVRPDKRTVAKFVSQSASYRCVLINGLHYYFWIPLNFLFVCFILEVGLAKTGSEYISNFCMTPLLIRIGRSVKRHLGIFLTKGTSRQGGARPVLKGLTNFTHVSEFSKVLPTLY